VGRSRWKDADGDVQAIAVTHMMMLLSMSERGISLIFMANEWQLHTFVTYIVNGYSSAADSEFNNGLRSLSTYDFTQKY
jgi:hypothetical protein